MSLHDDRNMLVMPAIEPSADEQFYARALVALSGPRRRTAALMRGLNIVYWSAVLLALAWLLSQALDRTVPITGRSQALIGRGAAPGAPLHVKYRLTRRNVCATDLSWTEIDGAGEVHRFGPKHVPVPGGVGADAFTYAWPTSFDAAPGPSILRVALEYRCPGNYLQVQMPLVERLPDLPYETLPPGPAAGTRP